MKCYRIEIIEKRVYSILVNAICEGAALEYMYKHPEKAEEFMPPEVESVRAIELSSE